jgi:hypothetical protein
LQLTHEMRKSESHYCVYHHLIKHPRAQFGRVGLLVQQIQNRIETSDTDHAQKYAVN